MNPSDTLAPRGEIARRDAAGRRHRQASCSKPILAK
jgi:hypothetical protein